MKYLVILGLAILVACAHAADESGESRESQSGSQSDESASGSGSREAGDEQADDSQSEQSEEERDEAEPSDDSQDEELDDGDLDAIVIDTDDMTPNQNYDEFTKLFIEALMRPSRPFGYPTWNPYRRFDYPMRDWRRPGNQWNGIGFPQPIPYYKNPVMYGRPQFDGIMPLDGGAPQPVDPRAKGPIVGGGRVPQTGPQVQPLPAVPA